MSACKKASHVQESAYFVKKYVQYKEQINKTYRTRMA